MIQLGFPWYSYFWELLTATVQMTQHPKLQNFDLLGPKRGSQTKICQLIWNQGPKISIIPKFEGPTLKNKNFKILTFWGPGGQSGGSKPNFIKWYEIRTPKLVRYQILKDLHWKTKILKFWPFEAPGAGTGAPNQNFSTDIKSGPQNECHIKKVVRTFRGPGGPSRGPEPKFFNWYKIRAQKSI